MQDFNRRQVLQNVTAGIAGIGFAGTSHAKQPDRYIVATDSKQAARAARRQADVVHRELDFGSIGQAVAGKFPTAARENLRKRPGTRYIEPEGTVQAISETTPWGVDRVDADVVHSDETGKGADIAIVDTGIDSDHPDLEANLGTGYAVETCSDSTGCYYDWDDDNGHGTHCAGIADAIDNAEGVIGVSTEATLHAVKVLDNYGGGTWSGVAEGIKWVADQGYDVASLSLGSSDASQTIKDACQYAVDNGVLLSAAAGNDGDCTDCVLYPAAYSTVIAVSATNEEDGLAYFSSTGPEVELAAPGKSIYSTWEGGEYKYKTGTSMACPHVSGAAGQLMANGYSNTEARDQLNATAEDIGLSDNEQGNGLLDVEAAVSDSGGDSAPSVSWANPNDGDTVSGTITVQLKASDSEDGDDTLDVTYSIDGGSSRSTTHNSTSGYYEDSYDTTGVSDGDHTLEATATDSAGNTSSASITVTTDNTESIPVVDSLSLSEVETSDSDAEFDADWAVSDADGDLTSIDLTLTDDTDGETEATTTVSISGDAASGTTRLVATDDEGTDNTYTVEAIVTDGAGNTDSATASATESESAPVVDSLSLSEVETDNGDAEFDADWAVSDTDGDLTSIDLTLTDDTDGETETTTTVSISGDSASGTTRLVATGDDGSGNSYTVDAIVTDSYGTAVSDTASTTETEVTDSASSIDTFSLTDNSNPAWTRYSVDWGVSDDDSDLSSVTTEMINSSGRTLDSASSSVSGSSASGTHDVRSKRTASEIVLTVTDEAGNSTSDSTPI